MAVIAGARPGHAPERPRVDGPARRSHRRTLLAVFVRSLVLGAVVAGIITSQVASTGAGRSPTKRLAAAGLPVLGSATAVEVNDSLLNDIGDPSIIPVPAGVDGMSQPGYVLYWTTDWLSNVPTAVSTDLIHWRRVADALPNLPSWALIDHPGPRWHAPAGVSTLTWGPTVRKVAGGWVLYYATGEAPSGRECIGSAFATSPVGPFTDTSTAPLVCQAALGGDIDPAVVAPAPGQLALVWKNDGNANDAPVGIWEQALTPDGRSTQGARVRLLGAHQAWEHGIIEGPSMLADRRGGWWLFYSGGTWQSNTYDTGAAWCTTVAGPCREPAAAPLLVSTPSAVSPGGLDTFVDHHGQLWASYSAFPSQPGNTEAAMASPRVLELAAVRSH